MHDTVALTLNGARHQVPAGTTVAVALMLAGQPCRISVSGEPRVALCGMGVCFECRAEVDGMAHMRTCQLICEEGMTVETNP
jgi:hypothetical protein